MQWYYLWEKRQKNHIATNKCIWNGTYLLVTVIDFLLKCQRSHPVSSVPLACHLCFEKAVMRCRSWLGCFDCYAPPLGGRVASHIIFHPCSSAFYPDQKLDGCARQPGNFGIHVCNGQHESHMSKHTVLSLFPTWENRGPESDAKCLESHSPPSQHHTLSEC